MFRIVQLDQNNAATGVVLRARANHEGEVHLQQVPAGRYRVQLEGHVVGNPVIEQGPFQVNPGTLNLHHARSRPRDWGK